MKSQLILLIIGVLCFATSSASNSSSKGVMEKIFEDYDKDLRPNHEGGPIEVSVSVYVNSFANIDETSMEYKVYFYLRQYWKDDRLVGKVNHTLAMTGLSASQLWKPDAYCENARESNLAEASDSVNSLVFLHPDGLVLYSRLSQVTAECKMDLRDFPMDTQKCNLVFGSYSYPTSDIVYKWRDDSAVEVGRRELAQFYFKSSQLASNTAVLSTGNFSLISVHFLFERRLGYFLIQVYAPDIFIVMLSWIVFWMDRNDIGNRMALGITTILTIMFLMGSINAAMLRVSYPKALDWYLMVSFTFIFLALFECLIAYGIEISASKSKTNSDLEYEEVQKEGKSVAYWIDYVSRILFPSLFAVYNIYYWGLYEFT
ncbi:gamma-aminobutyric acid receptor alpha-like [Actinia tenebrosa]|uniref:Gamma-aminobutyric acid receptor alpha-like n=1 Tax=Actinia tenebrosa TaxID=6105 RepID=A0A6P8I2M6_ACTTE|nr:gamma-aminobutyric acid receptor alpha-like [Actinia tenebrosa]